MMKFTEFLQRNVLGFLQTVVGFLSRIPIVGGFVNVVQFELGSLSAVRVDASVERKVPSAERCAYHVVPERTSRIL